VLRNVFIKSVRDERRSLLWWLLGIAALVLLSVLTYPSVRDAPDLTELVDQLPEGVKALLGGQLDLASPEGYLNARLFNLFLPLVFLIYAVTLASSAIAGEEEQGTLDLLLAYPVSRRSVVLQKFLAIAAAVVGLGGALWLVIWAGALLVDMGISAARLAAATISLLLLTLLFATLALALGCLTGRRSLSLGVSTAVALGAYLLNSLAPLVGWLEPYRLLSPFYYFIEADPLRNGLNVGHAAVLLAGSLILLAVAVPAFQRRDIGV
jgi:ABC-2 type transport system permease protein